MMKGWAGQHCSSEGEFAALGADRDQVGSPDRVKMLVEARDESWIREPRRAATALGRPAETGGPGEFAVTATSSPRAFLVGTAALATGLPGRPAAAPAMPNAGIHDFSDVSQDLRKHRQSGGPEINSGHVNADLSGFASGGSHSAHYQAQRSGVPDARDIADWNDGKPDAWTQAQLIHLIYQVRDTTRDRVPECGSAIISGWVNTLCSVSRCSDTSSEGSTRRASDDAARTIDMYDALGERNAHLSP